VSGKMPELRRDPITGRQVLIAPERASRPWHINIGASADRSETCPFCPGNEAMTPPEVCADRAPDSAPNTPGWQVRVVPNKYPALEDRAIPKEGGDSFYRMVDALGLHEVIIENAQHAVHMNALGAAELAGVLRAYRGRFTALEKDLRWKYLLIYKNQGERAGATLEHVHSQLVALPAVPCEAADEMIRARAHFDHAGRCIYCEIIERECKAPDRLVLDSGRFIALCPFAPRFAFETWILPKRHAAHFAPTSDEDLTALGEILRRFIVKLDAIAIQAPFNYLLRSAPLRQGADKFYHWHLEILPQLNRAAGFEWGSGMHMNPVAPEEAARLLRDTG
jgi:UDPglucose--hexose-1-phosphate uridylyltransferase